MRFWLRCRERETRAAPGVGCAPVPDQEVTVLKALRLGALALFLLVSPTALASSSEPKSDRHITHRGTDRPAARHVEPTLRSQIRHDQTVIRFFDQHRWLLTDPRFLTNARRELAVHRRHLARTRARLQQLERKRRLARRLAVVSVETPKQVICRVFGPYCGEAVRVAQCESGFRADAQNGQYLGLFQMGYEERRLFGHGPTAEVQARAAYRYFVASGRDWSPWSCKP